MNIDILQITVFRKLNDGSSELIEVLNKEDFETRWRKYQFALPERCTAFDESR